ncbi:hypothetical protein BDQ17DRAFT_1321230 [Cyathus striatus]|nr:hypothetical protein BDQ17DRAFT_1321230 [Cyathus striatus]
MSITLSFSSWPLMAYLRQYGKNKGKERETFVVTAASAAQTLSNAPPTPSPLRTYPSSSSILRTTTNNNYDRDRPLPATPAKKKPSFDLPPLPPSSTSSRIRPDPPPATPSPRKPTDAVTATLAQRLNELAQANSDGLLKYACLSLPSTVPLISPLSATMNIECSGKTSSSVSQPPPQYPPSLQSSLLPDQDPGKPAHPTLDRVVSDLQQTTSKFKLPRVLSKKSSNSSVRTTRSQADAVSITSRAAGIRRTAPPSAFRAVAGDNKYAHSVANIYDEENLKTSADIKQEILSVEAEARRLPPRTPETAKSQASFLDMGDARSGRRVQLARTVTPVPFDLRRQRVPDRRIPSIEGRKNSSSSMTSERKAAMRNNTIAPPVPALPASVGHLGIGIGNNSSVSLARSGHVPMSSVPEDGTEVGGDEVEEDYEGEMDDIKQRREEVRLRYEARWSIFGRS